MSSNTSSVPPVPPSEVGAAEAPEGAPRNGSNNCNHKNSRQPLLPAFGYLPYTYAWGPDSLYAPQYNPYHQPQLGYHHFRQAGYIYPFPQPDFRFSRPSLPVPVPQQTNPHDEHGTLPDQQQARQNVSVGDGMTAEDSSKSQYPLEDSKSIHLQPGPCAKKSGDNISLQPDPGVSFENVDEDQAVVEDRPPKKVIPRECLTRGEKMRLLDLLKQYEEVQRTRGVFCPATKIYQQFYQAIFRRSWDTNSKSYSPVTLRPVRSSDAYLEIGYYEKDAPSSRSDDGCRGSKALKKTIPIFLTLDLGTGEIDWRYYDKDGSRFKSRDVTLHHGLSIEQAKENVLDYQDQKEMKRICEHNINQIVHAARRRIAKWAAAGSAAQLGVDDEDRATLEILELPSERFLARFEEVRVLRDYLVQRPELSYED
ncbi:hypothetical protein FLAG1_02142 [Fusarium langsethiae]|uniref:Uncharacterized protein n=1 Tax=Fusarium langsethiae TaxID=179993 RepID=A0A0M9F2W0_FUSLA|nr:hypothetical protein FLAG1_02142 [Fusarium langsethiae]GKT98965.1 unnamed protein product [Fusarium langsethiae]GKU15439.1 unnamed protein product [Fusarium langsethiae]